MKLTLAGFCINLLSLTALSAAVYGQKLETVACNVPGGKTTVGRLFETLEQQTGYSFLLLDDKASSLLGQTVQLGRVNNLAEALKRLRKDARLDFAAKDRKIVVTRAVPPVRQKPGRINGKVVDDKGEPLAGASIKIVQTGQAMQSAVDGSYQLELRPGTYTLEVSYVSYQTKRITQIRVQDGQTTPLDVVLQVAPEQLAAVTVTADYRRASVEGLYARQKNAAELSNGISAEQISRTPDKNIGESLKRISGITTFDNKYIVVRGIGERYNAATLDGTLLPSTEAQSRNFSFDLIPTNIVDNVVVSKTVTPDMNASFGGGLVQVNTKDIPNADFMSLSIGASVNDQTTGKDFLSRKRGKYDYLGFDDGRRKFPTGLFMTDGATPEAILEQSKRFVNDPFTVYQNKAIPSQNYQLALGRLYVLKDDNRIGFTGSLSYRNTQQINASKRRRGAPGLPSHRTVPGLPPSTRATATVSTPPGVLCSMPGSSWATTSSACAIPTPTCSTTPSPTSPDGRQTGNPVKANLYPAASKKPTTPPLLICCRTS